MSFVLPGNARQLRFTGEAKALSSDAPPASQSPASMRNGPASALGKPRVRKPPPSAPPPVIVSTPVPSSRIRTPVGATGITTPSPGSGYPPPPPNGYPPPPASVRPPPSMRVSTPMPSYGGRNNPVVRHKSDSDDIATMAMDRDMMDVMPGGNLMRPPAMGGRHHHQHQQPISIRPPAPIPHFRAAPLPTAAPVPVIPPGTGSNRMKMSGAPYAVWVFASLLAGILSYHVAPEILAKFESKPTTVQTSQ